MDEETEHLRELLSPDFAAVERHFVHPVPEALRRLYRDARELARADFCAVVSETVFVHVLSYSPINQQTLAFFEDDGRLIKFADGYESVYLLDPAEADPPVMQRFLDAPDGLAGTVQPTGCTLSEFLAAPRHDADGPMD